MTTITIEKSVDIPKTHFKNFEELSKMIMQLNFELSLQNSAKDAMTKNYNELIDIK